MKKVLLGLLLVLGLTACGDKAETPKENEKPVVKIGVSLPLTGNLADTGASAKASDEMAFEKWNLFIFY